MNTKLLIIFLLFNLNLDAVTALFYLKNKTQYELGIYIDPACIVTENCEEKFGYLLYSIIEPDKEELIKLEKTIKETNKINKIIYENTKETKLICDYTKGKNFILEFTIIDSYDEFDTEIKMPIYNEKNQITRYKTEKLKVKKPNYRTISKTKEIIDNAKYEATYDEKTKELNIIEIKN